MAALRYGDYIAKISVAPESDSVKTLTGQQMQIESESTIRDLVRIFKHNTADYVIRALVLILNGCQLRMQQFTREEESPHQNIGILHFPSRILLVRPGGYIQMMSFSLILGMEFVNISH